MRKDIKKLNIPNVCFSLTDNKDKREKKYSKQRKKRGFDDSETWSLTDTICHFTIPRLKRFKQVNNGYPAYLTEESWNEVLDKIILAFELTSRDEGARDWNEEEHKQLEEGLDLFRKHFFDLWW
jgi:hypothetical protein